ncbi:hypothetical protein Tco_0253114 [Tanacetum coccineum]
MEAVSSPMVAAGKLLEVIVNGDSPPPKRTVDGVEQTYPLTTAEEKLARKNELKARGTFFMALPNEHQLQRRGFWIGSDKISNRRLMLLKAVSGLLLLLRLEAVNTVGVHEDNTAKA